MFGLLSYCLKLSVSLALVSIFYQLLLRKLTFYNCNRYFLLGYTFLSFFLAFINVSPVIREDGASHLTQWVPIFNTTEIVTNRGETAGSLITNEKMGLLLVVGMGLMLVRLMIQLFSFHRLKRKGEFIRTQGVKLYQVNHPVIPFSFGNSIFINRHLHSEDELREIIRHEFVHVRQRHSIDIVWGEIICVLNWYNPFAWLLKHSIRQNLEFIADNKVLKNGMNKKQYQYLLLKVIGNNQFSIVQKFNFSSLKKRIAMMNKSKSTRLTLVRFLFVMPLVAGLLLAFRNNNEPGSKSSGSGGAPDVAISLQVSPDTVPAKNTPVKPKVTRSEKNLSAVSDDFEISNERAVIHLKNGSVEEYDLKNKEQRKKFEDKYGKIVNATVHTDPMTAVSVVTADGVKTAIVPVNVVKAGISTTIAPSSDVSISNTVATTAIGSDAGVTVIATGRPTISNSVGAVVGEADYSNRGQEEILVVITRNTTREQLEEFKKQMKEKDVDLRFDDIKYGEDGKLVRIAGTMKSKNGSNNFSATSFNKLILSMIKDGDQIYFRVRTTNNKEVI